MWNTTLVLWNTTLVLSFLLATGCGGGQRATQHLGQPLQAKVQTVGVAPSVTLQQTGETPDDLPIRAGVFIGNARFSGGYVVEAQDAGQQTRAKHTDTTAQREYTDLALEHSYRAVSGVAGKRAQVVSWTPTTLPPVQMINTRGSHNYDGRDNVTLPRFTLKAPPLPADTLASAPPNAQALIGTYVVVYYSHNAGWFLGQHFGNAAGARYRLFVVTWSASTGQVESWSDEAARYLDEEVFQPNTGETEDFMLDVERQMDKQIRRHLWR